MEGADHDFNKPGNPELFHRIVMCGLETFSETEIDR